MASVNKMLQLYKNVILVGDGINDAPALAAATVGVAMGARGAAVGQRSMVSLVDDVTKVSDAVEIGRRTVRKSQNRAFMLVWSQFYLYGNSKFWLDSANRRCITSRSI